MAIVEITDENFAAEVEQADRPVLLDFWAPWCGYCRMLDPVVDALAADWADEGRAVTIGRVNIDEQPRLAASFGVDTVPTLISFKNGKMNRVEVGFKPKAAVAAMLD